MILSEVCSCAVCKTDTSDGWTCRGNHWLCKKCTKIPIAVFYNNDTVAVTFIGGPVDKEILIVPNYILSVGYRVDVQVRNPEHNVSKTAKTAEMQTYVDYKFDWDLGFFIPKKR